MSADADAPTMGETDVRVAQPDADAPDHRLVAVTTDSEAVQVVAFVREDACAADVEAAIDDLDREGRHLTGGATDR